MYWEGWQGHRLEISHAQFEQPPYCGGQVRSQKVLQERSKRCMRLEVEPQNPKKFMFVFSPEALQILL